LIRQLPILDRILQGEKPKSDGPRYGEIAVLTGKSVVIWSAPEPGVSGVTLASMFCYGGLTAAFLQRAATLSVRPSSFAAIQLGI